MPAQIGDKEMGAAIQALSDSMALLLSFYALGRIGWWWNVQTEGFKVQGRAHDLAMLAGTKPRTTEADWEALYSFYRYEMVPRPAMHITKACHARTHPWVHEDDRLG